MQDFSKNLTLPIDLKLKTPTPKLINFVFEKSTVTTEKNSDEQQIRIEPNIGICKNIFVQEKITDNFPPAITGPIACKVSETAKLLTNSGALKNSYEITIQLNNKISYTVGQALGISILNSNTDIEYIKSRLTDQNLNFDEIYKIGTFNGAKPLKFSHIPKFSSITYLFKFCLELNYPMISKSFLAALASHTSDNLEKRKIQELASRQGSQDYINFISNKFNILHFLNIFKTCNPSLNTLLNFLTRLKYRWYSACSLPNNSNLVKFAYTEISEKCGLKEGETEDIFNNFGLATKFLTNLKKNDDIFVVQRTPTNFTLHDPLNLQGSCLNPMILVATGTGLAPFLGFLEWIISKTPSQNSKTELLSNTFLYFGCRDPDLDFIYKDLLLGYVKNHKLNLKTTFSRCGNGPKYIQHEIANDLEKVLNLLKNSKASIYFCGDRSGASRELQKLLSDSSGKEFIEKLIFEKRIIEDLWS